MRLKWKRRSRGYESAAGMVYKSKRKWFWMPAPAIVSGLKDHGFDFCYEAKEAAKSKFAEHLAKMEPQTPSAILRSVIAHAERIKVVNPNIVGGESGPGARPCQLEWIRAIVRQCAEAGVPCFVKQLGTAWVRDGWYMSHATGETWAGKKGGNPDRWPPDLNVRQYPEVPRG